MSERLTVVSVAFPFARVGPDAVGGAEQVLSTIDAALVAAGFARDDPSARVCERHANGVMAWPARSQGKFLLATTYFRPAFSNRT